MLFGAVTMVVAPAVNNAAAMNLLSNILFTENFYLSIHFCIDLSKRHFYMIKFTNYKYKALLD